MAKAALDKAAFRPSEWDGSCGRPLYVSVLYGIFMSPAWISLIKLSEPLKSHAGGFKYTDASSSTHI